METTLKMTGRSGGDATSSNQDGLWRRPATCDRLQPCDQAPKAGPLTLNSRASAVSRVAQMATRRTNQTRARRRRLASFTLILLLTVSTCGWSAAGSRLGRRQATPGGETPPSTETAAATSTTTTTATTAAATAATSTTTSDTPLTGSPKARIPPVNFTRVDELFASVMDEEDVVRSWRKMDKTLQQGIGSLLKMIFPHVVSMASDAKVSGNCSGAILKWILNLKGMRTWAVQMLDAIGKPSAGLLEGSLTLFGNYRQCLKIRAPDEDEIEIADGEFREYFRGQYCRLQIRPPLARKPHFYSLNSSMPSLLRKSYKYYERTAYDELSELAMAFHFVDIRADLCVPSLCSRDDIQRVANFLTSKLDMRARVQRCDIQPYDDQEGAPLEGFAAASNSPARLDTSHLLWSLIMVVVLMLVLVSTLASLVLRVRKRNSKSKRRSLFTAMSLYRSLGRMRNVQLDRINATKPVVLYSLRTLILIWICLVSLTSQLNFQYLREMLTLRNLIMQWPLQLIVNSSLAFDSLILLTSFTYAYQNINSNFSDLIKYNISKYIRLMPSIMLLVALTIITPFLYQWQSPLWHDFVDEPAQVCKSTGLINLFFIQNLISSQHICLPQTWLFCVELQLCLLAIPIVYLMNRSFDSNQGRFRWSSKPILLVLLLALVGCLINFLNVYLNQLPAAWFQTFPDKEDKHQFNTLHLHKTWTHLTTFAVGLFAGHLCRCQTIGTFTGRPYGRRCCNTLMWLASSLLMFALIFSTRAWSLSGRAHLEAPLASALYAGLSPLLWSISFSMILFQLVVPQTDNKQQLQSGLSQWLSSDVNLIRIGRLSFLAYLLNPYVNTLVYAIQEQAIFSSLLMLGHFFIGNLITTFALAFLVSALVELPCRRLLKKLLVGSRRHSTNLDIIQRQSDQNRSSSHDSFLRHAPPPPPPSLLPLHVTSSAEQKYVKALGGQTAAPRQPQNPASFQQQQQQQQQQQMIPLK